MLARLEEQGDDPEGLRGRLPRTGDADFLHHALRAYRAFEVRLREVLAYEQQSASMFFGDFVGKAISEVQPGRMETLAPATIGARDASG